MKLWEEIEVANKKIQKVILPGPMIYSDTLFHHSAYGPTI
jgi:hypothetical protein